MDSSANQIMMSFLSQQGVVGADGLVDKAKFTKMMNDAKVVQNQIETSTWNAMVEMAKAWR
jgi:hypothetical protein